MRIVCVILLGLIESHLTFSLHFYSLPLLEELFFGTTPAQRPESPAFGSTERILFPPNLMSLHDEQRSKEEEPDEDWGGAEEDEEG